MPSAQILDTQNVKAIADKISSQIEIFWLSDNEAVDIIVHDSALALHQIKELAIQAIGQTFERAPVDVVVQSGQARQKKLLLSDMDSTIIQQECIDEIAYLAGIKTPIAAITERAMRGELDFEQALNDRVGLLENFDAKQLQTVIDTRITLTPGARTLVQTMKANGAITALVSGGFTFFTAQIAQQTGFDISRANKLEIKNGRLTGKVHLPILGASAKKQTLEELSQEHCISHQTTLAVGDGANDLEMIEAASLGVAYHAKPVVASKADAAVRHTDLHALLFMQGYRRKDFVE